MPPDYLGGITKRGVDNLKIFVENGGTLLCNKGSAGLAIDEFHLPVKNVLGGVRSDTFNCPGSILKVTYRTDHPLTFGMEEKGVGYFSRGQALEITSNTENDKQSEMNKTTITEIASYPDESLLLSGWILGEELIMGKAAILEVTFQRGKIVLFGFNIHNRAQSYGNFKLLFNAIYN